MPECFFTYEIADVSGNYMFLHPEETSFCHNFDLKINRLPHAEIKRRKAIFLKDICYSGSLYREKGKLNIVPGVSGS